MSTHPQAIERAFESLTIGESASCTHTISPGMVADFARITGDQNPLHTDETYALGTKHKKIVVHGMLTASLLSELVGMHLPGKYSLIVSQSTQFIRPVFISDKIVVTGTIAQKSESTRTVTLDIHMTRGAEEILRGTVIVLVENTA